MQMSEDLDMVLCSGSTLIHPSDCTNRTQENAAYFFESLERSLGWIYL